MPELLQAVAMTALGILAWFAVAMAVAWVTLEVKHRLEDRAFDRQVTRKRAELDAEPRLPRG